LKVVQFARLDELKLKSILFFQANILTGLVNLSVDTLFASSLTAFMILSKTLRLVAKENRLDHAAVPFCTQ